MIKKILLLSVLFYLTATIVAAQQNTLALNTNEAKNVINKNIYGHFAEHLGACIYEGMYVGEKNKTIPHTNGVRNDIIAALKKLKVPVLRWPGGCFADTYQWKDGIGPKNKRPSMVNRWWGGVTEDNSFGTHDFLNMCKAIGCEPYLAANVGSGTVQNFIDWIQYVNFKPGSSPMAKLREQNGKKLPWDVQIWGVGNEAWGCGGNMKPEYYANIYKQYATFMTDWTNSDKLLRVASGANGSDYHWTEVMMRDIPRNMLEGVALHHYSVIDWNKKGDAVNFSEEQYFRTLKSALFMDTLVTKHAAIMDKYDPEKKIALVVDEWGGWYDVQKGTNPGFLFQQNTIRDAMIAGVTLNIFNNHCDRVRMANLAQIVNVLQSVILTNKEKLILTPTYHVMEMYNVHQDATLIPTQIKSEDYSFGNEKLPAVSVSASKDKNGITHITLVNIDAAKEQTITLSQNGTKYNTISGRLLTTNEIQNYNSFENPNKIAPINFTGAILSDDMIKVKLPPLSVVVLNLN